MYPTPYGRVRLISDMSLQFIRDANQKVNEAILKLEEQLIEKWRNNAIRLAYPSALFLKDKTFHIYIPGSESEGYGGTLH